MSLFKWQMYAAQGMRNKWYSFMGEGMEESDDEQDSLKVRLDAPPNPNSSLQIVGRVWFQCTNCSLSFQVTFLETNPYLLGLTIVVSIVHSVFEFLAFKNGA